MRGLSIDWKANFLLKLQAGVLMSRTGRAAMISAQRAALCLSVLVSVANNGWAAGDMHVKKGDTWRVGADQASLNLDSLTLENGARIEFAPEVHLWQLNADVVRIGENVVIDGAGAKGAEGASGKVAAPANACQNGESGGNGEVGAIGEEGVTLALTLGVQQIGSLNISTLGGDGGNGGQGMPGQKAGDLDGCELTHGGEGGDGGRGGDGGSGGQVRVSVAIKGPNLSLDLIKERVSIHSVGGKGGQPGKGADGGEASPGRWLSMKTLTGDKKYVAGGQAGKNGKDGSPGQSGRPGVIDFNEDIKQRVSAMIEAGNRQMETLAADISGQKSAQLTQLTDMVTRLQASVNTLQEQVSAQKTAQEAVLQDMAALKKQLEMQTVPGRTNSPAVKTP